MPLFRLGTAGFAVLALAALGWIPGASPLAAQRSPSTDELDVLRLRQNFYVVAGAGANVSVQFGEDGVVLVDAGLAADSSRLLAAIRRLTGEPIRYIIDTTADADNVGGNGNLAKAGLALGGQQNTIGESSAAILSRLEVLNRMSAPTGKTSEFPVESWPTTTFFDKQKAIYLNDEAIVVFPLPPAHTDADSLVFFRRSDVIAAGNVIDTRQFPVIDVDKGGSIQGEIESLNRLVEMAVPSVPLVHRPGGTLIVPGHGRIMEQPDVVEYRDMVVVIRDVVRDLISKGLNLEQIQKAEPAKGYQIRYGRRPGSAVTRQFVESIYKSLTARK